MEHIDEFETFMAEAEPRLRRALCAGFGPDTGRDAACDALAWAWENWVKVRRLDNPIGYLYRVGHTAATRGRPRALPGVELPASEPPAHVEPAFAGALKDLTVMQRTAVVLVHGYGYTLREAGDVLGLSFSTVRNHVDRALDHLRTALKVEVGDVPR